MDKYVSVDNVTRYMSLQITFRNKLILINFTQDRLLDIKSMSKLIFCVYIYRIFSIVHRIYAYWEEVGHETKE